MGFKCGIVGLPNVGKSTLFNALTETIAAEAANYPFCTIEPNVGRVAVPDARLDNLAVIAGSAVKLPVSMDIVDIAGLVRGASKGEGLGNKFLSNIREVDAIIHVVRCFESLEITHVENSIDPVRDIELIEMELIIADHDSLEPRLNQLRSKNKHSQDRNILSEIALMDACVSALASGKTARSLLDAGYDYGALSGLQLITTKPYLYVCNVAESEVKTGNQYVEKVRALAKTKNTEVVVISAKIESEIAHIQDLEEKKFFLEALGLKETGLSQVIRCGYKILGLETFFTAGPKEARAWTIKKHTSAPKAAGVIHTDFERGFIRAEVISYEDYIKYNGEQGAKESGRMRSEGKDYKVADGDVIHFRFNV